MGIDSGTSESDGHVRVRPAEMPSASAGPVHKRALPLPGWQNHYARLVIAVDVLAMIASLALRQWWGSPPERADLPLVLAVVVLGLTVVCLFAARAWEPPVLGQGSEEFSRLAKAVGAAIVAFGLFGLALKLVEVRPWVFGVIPIAGLFGAIGRLLLRQLLHRRRNSGDCMHTVLAIGTEQAVTALIRRTRCAHHYGWQVTAACTPTGAGTGGALDILGVPVVGDLDAAATAALAGRHRIVSVAQAPGWTSSRLHTLAWDLEGAGVELVVDPGLMEVAGPRLHVAAVDGMTLLRLSAPRFTGLPRVVKNAVDRIAAALLLVLLLPVLAAIAVAVRLDGGPVLFRQTRTGQYGREFHMLKFRSMVVDAERRRDELMMFNDGSGPLFKMRNDPRVTRVGEVLRRYSLDELPQLFNVLIGQMSVVGPRPPLPSEVKAYGRDAQRRLLVRPGMTGLWQVSGRSDLSWEESVRLDLRYVENWNLPLDGLIIWRTFATVIRGSGAY